MNFKALEERRVDLQTQMTGILDTAKAEKRSLTAEEESEFTKCENEIREIDETIEREEKKMSNNTEIREIEQRESKQFVDYIRGVIENRSEGNLTTGSNGAIIPKTIAKKIVAKAYDLSSILRDATKYNTKGTLSIPVYGAEIVSLIKSTSVVGYIAVNDLTKMGDIIRSNTYEALFPLISVAFIYFLIVWVATTLVECGIHKIDPKKRKNKNILKGVVR